MIDAKDNNPIPSLKVPEKRPSAIPELKNDLIAGNGKRTMPHDLEQKIQTWQRHGRKILEEMRTECLTVMVNEMMMMITRDQEKRAAVQVVIEGIDTKRKAAARKINEGREIR